MPILYRSQYIPYLYKVSRIFSRIKLQNNKQTNKQTNKQKKQKNNPALFCTIMGAYRHDRIIHVLTISTCTPMSLYISVSIPRSNITNA